MGAGVDVCVGVAVGARVRLPSAVLAGWTLLPEVADASDACGSSLDPPQATRNTTRQTTTADRLLRPFTSNPEYQNATRALLCQPATREQLDGVAANLAHAIPAYMKTPGVSHRAFHVYLTVVTPRRSTIPPPRLIRPLPQAPPRLRQRLPPPRQQRQQLPLRAPWRPAGSRP